MATKDDESSEKIEWMYSASSHIDSEQYLLGKKISEHDMKLQCVSELGCSSNVANALVERCAKVDMETKLREDPLQLILSYEKQEHRRLMENRIKFKRLREIVERQSRALENTSNKVKKSLSKKHKKSSKKHTRRSSSPKSKQKEKANFTKCGSSSSDSEEDGEDLVKKYVALMQQQMNSAPPLPVDSIRDKKKHKPRKSPERNHKKEHRRLKDISSRSHQQNSSSSNHCSLDNWDKEKQKAQEKAREEMKRNAQVELDRRKRRSEAHLKELEKSLDSRDPHVIDYTTAFKDGLIRSSGPAQFIKEAFMNKAESLSLEESVKRRSHFRQNKHAIKTQNSYVRT